MPMLNESMSRLNTAFLPANINATAAKAALFAPGQPLVASFVFPGPADAVKKAELQAYLGTMPTAMKEGIRSSIRHSLTARPHILMTFTFSPQYDFKLETSQLPNTAYGEGAITLNIYGPFPSDVNPVRKYAQFQALTDELSRPSKMRSPRPAKRRASKSAKKSAGRA